MSGCKSLSFGRSKERDERKERPTTCPTGTLRSSRSQGLHRRAIHCPRWRRRSDPQGCGECKRIAGAILAMWRPYGPYPSIVAVLGCVERVWGDHPYYLLLPLLGDRRHRSTGCNTRATQHIVVRLVQYAGSAQPSLYLLPQLLIGLAGGTVWIKAAKWRPLDAHLLDTTGIRDTAV